MKSITYTITLLALSALAIVAYFIAFTVFAHVATHLVVWAFPASEVIPSWQVSAYRGIWATIGGIGMVCVGFLLEGVFGVGASEFEKDIEEMGREARDE